MNGAWWRALSAVFGVALSTSTAVAADPPSDHLPPLDRMAIWTLQGENSSISTGNLTDRYYTNGLRLGITSGNDWAPDLAQRIAGALFGAGRTRVSFDISQQIYTAADTSSYDPPPTDRPYAGLLLANAALVQDTLSSRGTVGLSLGLVGPSALAQSVQNDFHSIIGQSPTNGWGTQLHDEPVFELLAAKVWRIPTEPLGSLETDVLPDVSIGLGTVRVYGEAGAQFRFGRGLDSDFGVARIRPGESGDDAFIPVRPVGWYVFGGASVQAVGTDITLNGNTWQDSRSVPVTPVVAELEAGFAVIVRGMRLSYTQVFQSQEFQHQRDGLHQFGSLALSVRF
jgi:hypothetical protein